MFEDDIEQPIAGALTVVTLLVIAKFTFCQLCLGGLF
jgi:hypothetical protein